MFTTNPFAVLSASISPSIMQGYITLMILLVIAGTVFDVIHKGSAAYFFANWRKGKSSGTRPVDGGELVAIAVKTAVVDVLASGEFCNQKRRLAHLLGMYGFVAYALATAVMVYSYPTPAQPTPGIWTFLWWLGALLVCVGGYWFWFFIRVDVSAEGNSPLRIVQADIFILSLLGSATFGLLWALFQGGGALATIFFGLYVISTTLLFGTVPWSKFAHMFFKPAAAFEKRVAAANGSRANLPPPADKPATFGNPREHASHY